MRPRWIAVLCLALTIGLAAPPASAVVRETRIPLHDGKLRVGELSSILLSEMRLPAVRLPAVAELDLSGLRGNLFVHALNQALGDGWQVVADADALILRCDPDKLPRDLAQSKRAVRLFTAAAAPEATGNQNRQFGLFFPQPIQEDRPLVVLIHGLDCDGANWTSMANLLADAGYQIGLFSYPGDQPIEESVQLLVQQMTAVRKTYPAVRMNLIGHSMGGLLARAYIEGDGYAGGVDRLILIATPNQGTSWSRLHVMTELHEHYQLWKHQEDWKMSWMITDGLGEAAAQLRPDSEFLRKLNAGARREGVGYTIIAGSENPIIRHTANWIDAPAGWVPQPAENWWGIRHSRNKLQQWSQKLEKRQGDSDGPVSVSSTRLDGVEDFVILPADHTSLYYASGDTPPAAWETIRDRLAR